MRRTPVPRPFSEPNITIGAPASSTGTRGNVAPQRQAAKHLVGRQPEASTCSQDFVRSLLRLGKLVQLLAKPRVGPFELRMSTGILPQPESFVEQFDHLELTVSVVFRFV